MSDEVNTEAVNDTPRRKKKVSKEGWISLPDPESVHASKEVKSYLKRLNKAIEQLQKRVK